RGPILPAEPFIPKCQRFCCPQDPHLGNAWGSRAFLLLGAFYSSGTAMGYIEHSLARSETLLYRARFPAFYFVAAWGVLLASVLGALLVDASGYGPLWIGMVLLGVVAFLGILVPIWTTEIGVTNQRFIFKRGLLWRSTQELQLRAVEEVNLEQGLLGRLLNFGRLELRGTGVDDVRLPALADPMGLRRALQDGMAAAVAAGKPGAPPARAPAA